MYPGNCQEKGRVVCAAAAGWLTLSPQGGAVSNWLWFGSGSGSQSWPKALLCGEHGLGRTGCGTGGTGAGNARRGASREPRVCVCALGHVHLSSEGQDCQGAVAQPGLVWSMAARLQKLTGPAGQSGCLASCPRPREMSCPSEWSSGPSPGASTAGAVWKRCPRCGNNLFLFIYW